MLVSVGYVMLGLALLVRHLYKKIIVNGDERYTLPEKCIKVCL